MSAARISWLVVIGACAIAVVLLAFNGYTGYSTAMKNSGIVWNEATLSKFLADPMNTVQGTTMTYLGVTDPKERADLIAYLQQATQAGKACQLAK